jgi:hypothetical protein
MIIKFLIIQKRKETENWLERKCDYKEIRVKWDVILLRRIKDEWINWIRVKCIFEERDLWIYWYKVNISNQNWKMILVDELFI